MGDCGTVLVIDRDRVFRAVAEEVLARWGCRLLVADSADDGLALARADRPILAIVAVELQGLSGLAVVRELHDRHGDDLPVILVSSKHREPFDRTAGLLVGAEDYLLKPVDPGELSARLRRTVRRAGVALNGDNGNGTRASNRNGDASLSPREQEVLRLLASGRSQNQIAAELVISSKTVGTHIQHLLGKLGVHSRAEAVAAAYRRGLVDPDVQPHALDAALIGVD